MLRAMAAHRIHVTIGTRPEAIKLAPVVRALRDDGRHEVLVVTTGQHGDLVEPVLALFDIDVATDLALMQPGQSPAAFTGRAIEALGALFAESDSDLVLGQGDTGTVLATALACFYQGIPFAHVEAGLRSHDFTAPFPEEMHRVVAGRLASLHFAPTDHAATTLRDEGIEPERIHVTGNPVVDAVQWIRDRLPPPQNGSPAILVTAHRRESFGAPLDSICAAVRTIATQRDVRIVLPVHPNPAVRQRVRAALEGARGVELREPLGYAECIAAVRDARFVLTDSGGLQEECLALDTPVLVMRGKTERPEGVEAGGAQLVGTEEARIVAAALELLDEDAVWERMRGAVNPYGDGRAAERIVEVVRGFLG